MDMSSQLKFLVNYLLDERDGATREAVLLPDDEDELFSLYRSLTMERPPEPMKPDFLGAHGIMLAQKTLKKGVVDLNAISETAVKNFPHIYLWRGDITRLRMDAVVNPAEASLQGPYDPAIKNTDSEIHLYAGVELRMACARIITRLGDLCKEGQVEITSGFNIPARYVLHTVFPKASNKDDAEDADAKLSACYEKVLLKAVTSSRNRIAFPVLGPDECGLPLERAAEIAVQAFTSFCKDYPSLRVVICVTKDEEEKVYRALLEKKYT